MFDAEYTELRAKLQFGDYREKAKQSPGPL